VRPEERRVISIPSTAPSPYCSWFPDDLRQCAVAEFARIRALTRDNDLTSCEVG